MPEKTRVVFRKLDGEIYAVFPDRTYSTGFLLTYTHEGHHGGCNYRWYRQTKRATPEEYADLLKEIRGGTNYEIQVVKNISYKSWMWA